MDPQTDARAVESLTKRATTERTEHTEAMCSTRAACAAGREQRQNKRMRKTQSGLQGLSHALASAGHAASRRRVEQLGEFGDLGGCFPTGG
jgi:hypothetical protein